MASTASKLQYGTLEESAAYINTVNADLTPDEIKGALLGIIDHVRSIKAAAEQPKPEAVRAGAAINR